MGLEPYRKDQKGQRDVDESESRGGRRKRCAAAGVGSGERLAWAVWRGGGDSPGYAVVGGQRETIERVSLERTPLLIERLMRALSACGEKPRGGRALAGSRRKSGVEV